MRHKDLRDQVLEQAGKARQRHTDGYWATFWSSANVVVHIKVSASIFGAVLSKG